MYTPGSGLLPCATSRTLAKRAQQTNNILKYVVGTQKNRLNETVLLITKIYAKNYG